MAATRTVTKAALARELGISRQRVGEFVELGMPVRPDGTLNRARARAWVRANVAQDLRPTERPPR
jgi:hypothetical protein